MRSYEQYQYAHIIFYPEKHEYVVAYLTSEQSKGAKFDTLAEAFQSLVKVGYRLHTWDGTRYLFERTPEMQRIASRRPTVTTNDQFTR
jgi:hypothetical protein